MHELGSTSKGRSQVRSPNPHGLDDPKTYRRKYEQAREALKVERKNN